ncbi:MAG: hypothetical protein GX567_17895 [Clostridia bacterium]|nr:hypothetical protein [Clostridia bacterium]
MKKLVTKLIVFLLILGLIFIPVNVIIDPYNIFHYEEPRNNGVEPNKNFIKTKYVIHNQDKFDSLVFGSSRAGFFNVSKLTDGVYYDMASSEALPAEHVRTLNILIQHGFIPKNVIMLIDDITCFVDPKMHERILYRVPYPDQDILSQLSFYARYCDLITTYEALEVIKEENPVDPDFLERYQTTGTENLEITSEFDGTNAVGYWADYYELRTDEAISDIQDMIDLCNQYDIHLTIMTNPLYHKTYARAVESGYLEFIERLSETTDFYNFSGINHVTIEDRCYYEASHYTAQVSEWMISAAFQDEIDPVVKAQGFGVHVTQENREEFISLLKEQAREKGIRIYGE